MHPHVRQASYQHRQQSMYKKTSTTTTTKKKLTKEATKRLAYYTSWWSKIRYQFILLRKTRCMQHACVPCNIFSYVFCSFFRTKNQASRMVLNTLLLCSCGHCYTALLLSSSTCFVVFFAFFFVCSFAFITFLRSLLCVPLIRLIGFCQTIAYYTKSK